MKYILITITVVLIISSRVEAFPINVEGSLGMSQYQTGADGCWEKTGYYTENHLKDFAWSVGVSQEPITFNKFSLGWRSAYVDLGNIRSHNKQCVSKDSNTDTCFVKPSLAVAEFWDNGGGSVKGGILGLTARYYIWDKLSVQVEGGAWLYWADWEVGVNSSVYRMNSAGSLSYYYGGRIQYKYFFIGAKFFPDTEAIGGQYGWHGMYRGVNYYEAGISISLW